jgi:hypothetical protein
VIKIKRRASVGNVMRALSRCAESLLIYSRNANKIDVVTLYTREGHEVIKIMTARFPHPVEAVMWGERLFFWKSELKQYREGTLWICPAGSEVKS